MTKKMSNNKNNNNKEEQQQLEKVELRAASWFIHNDMLIYIIRIYIRKLD